jgi:hypothetical protein
MGEVKISYTNLARKLEGMRPLLRPECKWKDNIGMYLKKWDMDWIQLAQNVEQ